VKIFSYLYFIKIEGLGLKGLAYIGYQVKLLTNFADLAIATFYLIKHDYKFIYCTFYEVLIF
jgi:hypothetical protein